jgi:hypothetical protein
MNHCVLILSGVVLFSSGLYRAQDKPAPLVTLTNRHVQKFNFFTWAQDAYPTSKVEMGRLKSAVKDFQKQYITDVGCHNTALTEVSDLIETGIFIDPKIVTTFCIENNKFSSLQSFDSFKNITIFRADRNALTDICVLALLRHLKEVSVSYNPELSDIEPLGKLEKLKIVRLEDCKIVDPMPLKNRLLYLEELIVTNNPFDAEKLKELIEHISIAREEACCYDNAASKTIHLHLVTQKINTLAKQLKEYECRMALLQKNQKEIKKELENDKKLL